MKRKRQLALDKRDMKLLYLLDVNGRESLSNLGKGLRMSKQFVKYRIGRLEKEGFIKGYFPMIDTTRLGLISFRVYLKFQGLNPDKKQEIIESLKRDKLVWAVILVAGKWDLALGIGVKNIFQFYEVWDKFLEKYIQYIKSYNVTIYSPIYHYPSSYLTEEKKTPKTRILGGKEKYDYDQKDIKILIELSKNARAPLIDISERVGLSPDAVNRRIKNLEKEGVIQGYRAMIDITKLGYQFYKADIRLTKYSEINELYLFCQNHPNIYQIDKTIGGETFEVEFHVKSLKDMFDIIGEMQKVFPNTIGSFDYFAFLGQEKITYMPDIKI